MSLLDEIVHYTKKRVEYEKKMFKLPEDRDVPLLSLRAKLMESSKWSIIAEYKRASPSKIINLRISCEEFVKHTLQYVTAYSVLTEPRWFLGSYIFLRQIKELSGKPVLMKDFIVDKWQIDLAYNIGADIVLLIVKVLGKDTIEFFDYAKSIGIDAIIEVDNIEHAKQIVSTLSRGEAILGVNARDLTTLDVNIERCVNIIREVEYDGPIIAESGIRNERDLEKFVSVRSKVRGFLIGTSIMENVDLVRRLYEQCLRLS